MLENAKWLAAEGIEGCPEWLRRFSLPGDARRLVHATVSMTACGVYYATINGKPLGDFVLAPGWTDYRYRQQVQVYDVTALLETENIWSVTVASGWYCGKITRGAMPADPTLLWIGELTLTFTDGTKEVYVSDENWSVRESKIRFSDIYDGEQYDACFVSAEKPAVTRTHNKQQLIPQEGEKIVYRDTVYPIALLHTPAGETVLDFGQEITGVPQFTTEAPAGTRIRITCAEMLDRDGNFYRENYRDARSEIVYICDGNRVTWQPRLSFFGFRYLRVEGIEPCLEDFRALVIASDLRMTGRLTTGDIRLNRLFENIHWGQIGNFLDVPTDCPQRDERLGWTGDAQVFTNTACYQYDVKKFFTKWLEDMRVGQRANGAVPFVIPPVSYPAEEHERSSTAWADAATVCPWQVFRHYGDRALLRRHFPMMCKWVEYIGKHTTTPYLWTGYTAAFGKDHYGDWLGLDAAEGSYTGSSDKEFIASTFYYYSTGLVIRAGEALGEDVTAYRELAEHIRETFREHFPLPKTQTECVLSLYFDLAEDAGKTADQLAAMVRENGNRLTTGFVGTPYLLYALSQNGHADTAYALLLQNRFPSWLYSVEHGATTIWEHWDGLREDGTFWSPNMNSFNHYAYGAVAAWIFEEAAGITPEEPGFTKIRIAPKPDERLGWLRAELDTQQGKLESQWVYENGRVRYTITTPADTVLVLDGVTREVTAGSYVF